MKDDCITQILIASLIHGSIKGWEKKVFQLGSESLKTGRGEAGGEGKGRAVGKGTGLFKSRPIDSLPVSLSRTRVMMEIAFLLSASGLWALSSSVTPGNKKKWRHI